LARLSRASSYRVLAPRRRKNLRVVSSISSWAEAVGIRIVRLNIEDKLGLAAHLRVIVSGRNQYPDTAHPLGVLRMARKRRYRRPSRAANQRDDLALVQLTGLHRLPLAQNGSIEDWRESVRCLLQCGIYLRLLSASGVRRGKAALSSG
jgi:hypothetical protein